MTAALPPLYDRWVNGAIGESLASEPRATCATCAMLGPVENAFDPSTKCCTFHPFLSNFNIGGVLAEGGAPTQVIAERIAQGPGVTPLGIAVPAIYRNVYSEGNKQPSVFGRVPQLRCPYYLQKSGHCSIHLHRDAVCSTWFCKFERGTLGKQTWTMVRKLLFQIERSLRIWCLQTLDVGAKALELALVSDASNKPLDEHDIRNSRDLALYRRSWGRYLGKEREFYLACAEAVGKLEWRDLEPIVGAEGLALVRSLRDLRQRARELPDAVSEGGAGFVQLSPTPGMGRLRHRSLLYDAVDVPWAPLGSLSRLTGRPLATVLAELRAEGIALDEALVQKLLDYEVLLPIDHS
jgi:Fe-S-cluster containining protein